jgi:hydrogenase/urease accessory protein HupE
MVVVKIFLAAVIAWFVNLFVAGYILALINIPIPFANLILQAVVFGLIVVLFYELLGKLKR